MNDYGKRLKQLEYYFSLLVPMVNSSVSPFHFAILKYELSREEVGVILDSCDRINNRYIVEKEEGFVHFEPLFQQFIQTVPPHVPIMELVNALKEQQYYPSLMDEFMKILKN